MKVVHLPYYEDNAYQRLLMEALERQGVETLPGGGGGTFGRTALQVWKPDVLHFHWLHPYIIGPNRLSTVQRGLLLLIQARVLRARGTRIAWTIHNLSNHARAQSGLEQFFTRRFARLCDAAITHCEVARHEAVRAFGLPPSHVHVLPHGNYIGCYPDEVSQDEARRELGLPATSLVFGFMGRIEPYKGVLRLVRVFKTLPQPNLRLLIVGRASDEDIALIRDEIGSDQRVIFIPGYVPDEEVQTYLKACDAVVFPYRDILASGAVVLAMSFGRACIAPRFGCLPETLDADGAFMYDALPGDEAGDGVLRTAMDEAIRHHDRLAEMGRHNYTLARDWDWDGIARQTQAIYERCGTR